MNILKSSTFFFFWSLTENFQTTFVRKTPKSTFFFLFFWSLTGFFFQKKLVRQVIKLEWPNKKMWLIVRNSTLRQGYHEAIIFYCKYYHDSCVHHNFSNEFTCQQCLPLWMMSLFKIYYHLWWQRCSSHSHRWMVADDFVKFIYTILKLHCRYQMVYV